MSHETPTNPDDENDELDRLSDQFGSYDDGQWRRSRPTGSSEKPWEEIEADKAKPPMTSAERRRLGRIATGPQYGDDALPVEDQSRSVEGYEQLRAQARPVADQLFEERIQRVRANAIERGENPDALEQMMRNRRAEERGE